MTIGDDYLISTTFAGICDDDGQKLTGPRGWCGG